MKTAVKCVVACLLVLAACHAPTSGETLTESVRSYNEGVRWQRYAVAATHIPAAERSDFVDEADERSKDLKITEYEIMKVEQKGDNEAKVQVKVSWYLDSVGKLKETQAVQTWERHGKTWLVVEESRLRGDEMPGLREAPMQE